MSGVITKGSGDVSMMTDLDRRFEVMDEFIKDINRMLKRFGCSVPIEMVRIKYLNNMVEQDHHFIKRRVKPMLGFKSFASAVSTTASGAGAG